MGSNGTAPPALGDVEIRRVGDTEWAVQRDGRRLVSGLDFNQVLQIVRGELPIDALTGRKNGSDNKDISV